MSEEEIRDSNNKNYEESYSTIYKIYKGNNLMIHCNRRPKGITKADSEAQTENLVNEGTEKAPTLSEMVRYFFNASYRIDCSEHRSKKMVPLLLTKSISSVTVFSDR
jgi:hypothetical protein